MLQFLIVDQKAWYYSISTTLPFNQISYGAITIILNFILPGCWSKGASMSVANIGEMSAGLNDCTPYFKMGYGN